MLKRKTYYCLFYCYFIYFNTETCVCAEQKKLGILLIIWTIPVQFLSIKIHNVLCLMDVHVTWWRNLFRRLQ